MTERKKSFDRSKAAFWLASFLIVFCYGVMVGRFRVFPFSIMKLGEDAVSSVIQERKTILGVRPEHFLGKARNEGKGITRYEKDRTAPGLTLLEGFFDGSNEIRLISPDGSMVRNWRVAFFNLIKDTSFIKDDYFVPKTDWNVEIQGAVALPDGSVVFNFERTGLVKLDRCGAVVWTLHRMTHHSVEPSADGGFWVPGLRYVESKDQSPFPMLPTPYYEDTLMKISAEGEVVKEISFLGLFFGNNLVSGILLANGLPGIELAKSRGKVPQEITHLNDIEELSVELAHRFPQFAAGDLLLSERDYNLIMVVDPNTQKVKWYQQGPWLRQHDPDFGENKKITIFSNNNDSTQDGTLLGGSTVLELDPISGEVRTKFGGDPKRRMYTDIRGKHQILANGNMLITESNSGRVLEVDSEGNIVWEFINRYDETSVAIVTQATRYPDGHFTVRDWTCQ